MTLQVYIYVSSCLQSLTHIAKFNDECCFLVCRVFKNYKKCCVMVVKKLCAIIYI